MIFILNSIIMSDKKDNIYIYTWDELNTIYIGRTINPNSRHYQHRHMPTERTYKFSDEHGVEHPKMVIIENNLTLDEGIEREKYWIEYYRSNSQYSVLNKLDGGQTGTSDGIKWTKEAVFEEAKKYMTRAELKYANNTVYTVARTNGWLDELFGVEKNKKPIRKWTKEAVFEEARKYTKKYHFEKECESAYKVAVKNKWIEEMTWFKPNDYFVKWTKELTLEESKKYATKKQFHKSSPGAYQSARINGWLKEMVWLKPGIKWTRETVFEESKKYTTKVEFKKSSSVAYRVAVKNEWIKEMTWIKGKINVDGK